MFQMERQQLRWAFNFKNWSPKKEEWMHCLSLIQPEEKERIGKFVFKKDAKASLVGRLMMRKGVSECFEIPWSSFTLKRSIRGRPFYYQAALGERPNFDFNVSHQGKWVVLAAESSGSKVGVDIMEIERASNKNVPDFFSLMNRQFTSEEWKVIKMESDENKQLKAFYRNWCLKEALVKSLGVGISYNLQSISFKPFMNLTLGSIIKDTQVKVNETIDPSWHFEESLIDESHIATVAFQYLDPSPKELMHFQVLTYEELILNSQQMTPPDPKVATEFIEKDESPFKH